MMKPYAQQIQEICGFELASSNKFPSLKRVQVVMSLEELAQNFPEISQSFWECLEFFKPQSVHVIKKHGAVFRLYVCRHLCQQDKSKGNN